MMKAFVASLLLFIAAPLLAQVVALRVGAVIDPARGTIAKNQVILVEHGKIQRIGGQAAIPAGAAVIDLSKEWMTPGLIDAHTHMTLSEISADAPFRSRTSRACAGSIS